MTEKQSVIWWKWCEIRIRGGLLDLDIVEPGWGICLPVLVTDSKGRWQGDRSGCRQWHREERAAKRWSVAMDEQGRPPHIIGKGGGMNFFDRALIDGGKSLHRRRRKTPSGS